MADWLEKYKPVYGLLRQVDEWLPAYRTAAILLNIDDISKLGRLLIAHRSNKTRDGKYLINEGILIENWVKENLKNDPDFTSILNEIEEHHRDEFTMLFIRYLALFRSLSRSDVIMNPSTVQENGDQFVVKVIACIEWAESKGLHVSKNIKNAYNNVHADLDYTMPTITRENDINKCVLDVIKSFEKANGYPPTSHEEVINRLRFKPTPDVTVKFSEGGKIISLNNQEFSNTQLKSTIKYLLGQIKISTSTNC